MKRTKIPHNPKHHSYRYACGATCATHTGDSTEDIDGRLGGSFGGEIWRESDGDGGGGTAASDMASGLL